MPAIELRNTEPRTRLSALPATSPVVLPPPELRAAYPELDKACIAVERYRTERRDAKRALNQAQAEVRHAEVNDIRAAAEAHRAGKADPGSPNVDDLKRRIAALERQTSILTTTLAAAEQDLADVIVAGRAAWVADIAEEATKKRRLTGKAVETWAETRHEVSQLEGFSRWLSGWPARPSWTPGNRHMFVAGPEGTRVATGPSYDEVRQMLVTDAAGPTDRGPQQVTVSDEAA